MSLLLDSFPFVPARMRALWLLAAVLLPLLPSPAAACERVPPAAEAGYEAASPPHAGDQMRASAGFEMVAAREQGRLRSRSPRSVTPNPWAPALPEPAQAASARRPDGLPAPRGSTPVCERLSYHATAPPLRG